MTSILTGYPDLDTHMMVLLPYEDLQNLCQVNQYTAKLCKNQQLWKLRIDKENLTLPIKITDWKKAYQILTEVNNIIKDILYFSDDDSIDLDVNQFKINYYVNLFTPYDEHFDIHNNYHVHELVLYKNTHRNIFGIGLRLYTDNIKKLNYERVELTKEQC